tara:strand:+ start:1107 stop:1772 length:666 start_codon:yes stop_codon:yes gene_type:complete
VEAEPIADATLNNLPVFPLPNVVLFPGTILPLRVFEPRYCQLLKHILQEDRLLSIALIKPEALEEETPNLYPVASLGRVIHAEHSADDEYNILVHGLQRIELLNEQPQQDLYRTFATRLVPMHSEEDLDRASEQLGRLQSCVLALKTAAHNADEQLIEVLRSTSDPMALADILAASLISNIDMQQQILGATNIPDRLEQLIEALAEPLARLEQANQHGGIN